MTWEIQIINPRGATFLADSLVDYPKITKYSDDDRPNSAEIDISSKTPVLKYADVDLISNGSIVLRGIVTDVEEKGSYQRMEVYSKEWLLKKRFTFYYTYTHDDATVGEMLEDDLTGDYVGLLAMARSLLPPNMFSLYSGSTYKLTGGGTGSVFGSAIPYHGTTALTLGSGAGSLTAGQYWRDASDLYVHLVGSANPRYELVSMADWCDPGVRLGDISDISAETFAAPYRLAPGRSVWEYIQQLIKATGAYIRWRAHANDPYIYLDASLSSFGRGSASSGVINFSPTEHKILRIAPDDLEVHGVIGIGAGDGKTIEMLSTLDLSASGNIVLDVHRDGYLYEEHLAGAISKIYDDRRVSDCFKISGPVVPIDCDDWVSIDRQTRQIVKKIETDYNTMTVWTGKRPRDAADAIAATNALLQEQSSFGQSHLNMWSDSHTGNVTNDVPLVWNPDFSDDNGVIDTSFTAATRIYLSFSIGWYKADVSGVDTQSHSHTGRTGSGGSSSHGNAGSGGGHYHGVSGTTTGVPTLFSAVIDYISVKSANASHNHSGASHYHDVNSHSHSIGGYNDYLSGVTSGHQHYYYATHSSGTGSSSPSTGYGSSANTGTSNASHSHDSTVTMVYVASDAHDHPIEGYTTGTHAGHADHSVTDNPTHDLPTYTEPLTAADVDKFLSEESTGSLKYLTIRLYANSVEVPGSPFEDYYIGDSEGAIDVTDLINIGGANEIEAQISEYGGAGDVRCELSMSLAAQVVLTSI